MSITNEHFFILGLAAYVWIVIQGIRKERILKALVGNLVTLQTRNETKDLELTAFVARQSTYNQVVADVLAKLSGLGEAAQAFNQSVGDLKQRIRALEDSNQQRDAVNEDLIRNQVEILSSQQLEILRKELENPKNRPSTFIDFSNLSVDQILDLVGKVGPLAEIMSKYVNRNGTGATKS